jgi:GNAT superfamily N-acetyltransferase
MNEFPVVGFEKAKHEAAYLRFLEKVLGTEKFSTRKIAVAWLHDHHPLAKRAPLRFVVTDGERIAGSMGHMPADYMIKGERTPVRITHDLLVDPDYRGLGIAKRIVDHSKSTGDFYPGGMWMNVPCYKIHRACGFDDVVAPTTQTLVFDPKRFVERHGLNPAKKAAGLVALGIARARAMKKARATVSSAGRDSTLRTIPEFDPALDSRWLAMAKSYDIAACREAAFLNWKYSRHPVVRYELLVAERGGEATGFVIWRLPRDADPERRAVIVDFLVEIGDTATLASMLSRVILDAEARGAEALSFMTTQPRAVSLIRSFGFLPRREGHTWVVANWEGRIPREWLRSPESWHVSLGDSDGDFWTGGQ